MSEVELTDSERLDRLEKVMGDVVKAVCILAKHTLRRDFDTDDPVEILNLIVNDSKLDRPSNSAARLGRIELAIRAAAEGKDIHQIDRILGRRNEPQPIPVTPRPTTP